MRGGKCYREQHPLRHLLARIARIDAFFPTPVPYQVPYRLRKAHTFGMPPGVNFDFAHFQEDETCDDHPLEARNLTSDIFTVISDLLCVRKEVESSIHSQFT